MRYSHGRKVTEVNQRMKEQEIQTKALVKGAKIKKKKGENGSEAEKQPGIDTDTPHRTTAGT